MAATAAHVDQVVEEQALALLTDKGTRKALAKMQSERPDTGPLLAAIDRDEELLVEIDADRIAGRLDRARYLAMQQPVEDRLSQTKAALARLDAAVAVPVNLPSVEDIESHWDAAPLAQKRAWLSAILDRVTITKSAVKAPNFDRDRVKCVWRV
jgi:hypothetical protein